MPARNLISGQKVTPEKVQRSKELRREMTREETVLWEHLRANRLAGLHFRRQQVIDGFIVDFYCHAVGLVVEIDGEIHQQQIPYDTERDVIVSARGLRILRIRNHEIWEDLAGVLDRIARGCRGL